MNSKNYKYSLLSQNIAYYIKTFEDTYKILSSSGIHFPAKIIKNDDDIVRNYNFEPCQKPKIYELHYRDRTDWNDEEKESFSPTKKKKEKHFESNKKTIKAESFKLNSTLEKKSVLVINNKYKTHSRRINSNADKFSDQFISNKFGINNNSNKLTNLRINIYAGNDNYFFNYNNDIYLTQKKAFPKPEYSNINYEFEGEINIKDNLTSTQLDYLKTDKNGLKNAIQRMLYSKINEIYPEKISKNSKDPNQEELQALFTEKDIKDEVKNLDKLSILLSLHFLRSTILSLKNYTNTNFIIAIDCCRNINISEKLVNLILAISLSKCLFYLEITFSIIIFSDYKFQYIIKNFYEKFSINIIQRLYNCIIIQRFFSRIFDVCYYIENKIDFPFENKMAIIISNGIDHSLKLGDKWNQYFTKNIKYCFFFNDSQIQKQEEIRKIWESFEKATAFPVITFNLETIKQFAVDTNKFQNLLRTFSDEKIDKSNIVAASYDEYFDYYIDSLSPEYHDINLYYSHKDNAFVQINQKEKPSQKIIFNNYNIINCYGIKASENNSNCEIFLKEFEDNLPIYNQKLIDDLFPPNKPTLYAPSNKGTKLNFSGLLNFFITNGQEDKIWLEKRDRLKKDYRISIVIDSSRSCFNKDSFYYSFSIIKALFNLIYSSKIPYFDLIIATDNNPIVICSGQDSNILNDKSFIWTSLISKLIGEKTYESNNISCNLFDAIYLALQIKIQQTSKKFFCFVLTDGIFNENYKNTLKNLCSFCENSQVNIYGIGIGLYPEGLPDIFSKCLWSPNIKYFNQALSSLLKNEKIFSSEFNLTPKIDNKTINLKNELTTCINQLSNHYMKYCSNIKIYQFLNNRKVYIESLQEIMHIDPLYKDLSLTNQENLENKSMFEEGFFKNFKILICCFWSKSISSSLERDEVDYKYLKKRFKENKKCLADVVEYYGIDKKDIKVVVNYEQGIREMRTGKYYATWIICGNGRGVLPDGGNENLVGQFINCTIRYWKKGGSLVWWCDNEPLCFEFNLFMQIAQSEFPGGINNLFHFGGNNEGANVMVAGDINKNPIQRFNNQRYFELGDLGNNFKVDKFSVPALGHGLSKIAIGTTVSYAQDINNNP